jgi:tRNA pseudouridine32 synthase/23S rRNA pseudouridine746 synthase
MNVPLPIIHGVAPSCVWLPKGDWPTLLAFFETRFPDVLTTTWQARMAKQQVVDEFGVCFYADSPYRSGVRVYYYRELEAETHIPFTETILYQDDHILVADKPHFLPVIPAGRFLHETLLVRLKKQLQLDDLVPIHRIDRETAGLVIFSHNAASRGAYQSLFKKREIDKVYQALAPTRASLSFPLIYKSRLVDGEPFFRMQEVAGEPNSETSIDVLESFGDVSLYQLRPITGRKHQLRVHLSALGMPILNDEFYPQLQPSKGDDFTHPLQLLAKAVAFVDPLTGQQHYFESERTLRL